MSGGFNPRTREGATLPILRKLLLLFSFNPRTREGATNARQGIPNYQAVSIHAPVRVRPLTSLPSVP